MSCCDRVVQIQLAVNNASNQAVSMRKEDRLVLLKLTLVFCELLDRRKLNAGKLRLYDQ